MLYYPPEVFCKKSVFKNFIKFTGNACARISFLIKLHACNFIKKETLAQVFSCEFFKIFKNTLFTEQLWRTASVSLTIQALSLVNLVNQPCWFFATSSTMITTTPLKVTSQIQPYQIWSITATPQISVKIKTRFFYLQSFSKIP